MNLMSQILAVVGQVMLVAVLVTLLVSMFLHELKRLRIVVAVLLVIFMLVPVNGLSISQWLRSATGDLSVLMLVMLLNILAQRLFDFKLLSVPSRQILLWGALLVGAVFYPFALGLGPIDLYHFGYAPVGMSILLTLVSLSCWLAGKRDLAMVMLLPLLAFNLHMLESTNLWDYLLDPILLMYALVQSCSRIGWQRFFKPGV